MFLHHYSTAPPYRRGRRWFSRIGYHGIGTVVMSRVLPISNSEGAEEEDECGDSMIERNVSSFLRARRSLANRIAIWRAALTYENIKKAAVCLLDTASFKLSISVSIIVDLVLSFNLSLV